MIDRLLWAVGFGCTSGLYSKRLQDFEEIEIESILHRRDGRTVFREALRPPPLVAAVYHPPSSSAKQNYMLMAHLQRYIVNYLARLPLANGDYNW